MWKNFSTRRKDISKRLHEAASAELNHLYRQSVIERHLGRFGVHDHVEDLIHTPLGMFFYNQRFLFLLAALMYVILLHAMILVANTSDVVRETVWYLTYILFFTGLATLASHGWFRKKVSLNAGEMSLSAGRGLQPTSPAVSQALPPIFQAYFMLDFAILLSATFYGTWRDFPVRSLSFLAIANTVVYTAYLANDPNIRRRLYTLTAIVGLTLACYVYSIQGFSVPRPFESPQISILYFSPMIAAVFLTMFTVLLISRLRNLEYYLTRRYLHLLGELSKRLALPSETTPEEETRPGPNSYRTWSRGQPYYDELTRILTDVCSYGPPFWFSVARFWAVEPTKVGKSACIPLASVNCLSSRNIPELVATHAQDPEHSKLTIVSSLPRALGDASQPNIPCAVLSIARENSRAAILELRGRENGPPLLPYDRAFLESVQSQLTTVTSMRHYALMAQSLRSMDSLLAVPNKKALLDGAADIMCTLLQASACIVLLKSTHSNQLEVEATVNVDEKKLALDEYIVPIDLKSQTGTCAVTVEPVWWDNVPENRGEFSEPLLGVLERAIGQQIVSWAAFPIASSEGRLLGVIKVLNRTSPYEGFTVFDRELGWAMSMRLYIILRKFLSEEEAHLAELSG